MCRGSYGGVGHYHRTKGGKDCLLYGGYLSVFCGEEGTRFLYQHRGNTYEAVVGENGIEAGIDYVFECVDGTWKPKEI